MKQQKQLTKIDILATLRWYAEVGVTDVISSDITNYSDASFPNIRNFLNEANDVKEKPVPILKNLDIQTADISKSYIEKNPDSLGTAEASIEAKKLATKVGNIEDLKKAIESFNGCPLKRTAMNMVFADGNPNSKIMLVGEAPGADEDRVGKPFVGQSGKLLDKMFGAIGLDRDSIYISNIVNWRPPGNRTPSTSEIAICTAFIKRHIELVEPEILIYVGNISAKTLLESSLGITKLRGKWFDYTSENLKKSIKSMAIFHPAFLLRSPAQKRLAWKDLLEIKSQIKKL